MKKLLKSEICGSVNTGSLFTLKSQQNRLLKKKKKVKKQNTTQEMRIQTAPEEVKIIVLPMVHKVQEEIILIPHIDFVIPNEFDVVELKVFLFPVLSKVILDLKQVLFVSILILQCFKTRG